MNKRIGFVGIIIENRKVNASLVNKVLSEYADFIVARTGVPVKERNCSVINLVVDISTDDCGSLTGRLGKIEGVSVRSVLSKEKKDV
ncbi:MAG: CopG family transcriptional regulator [Candidatus Gygaella obscura]|nr:CopG family transcriptional regulator [Candidatus Gygaella obscura]